MATCSTCRSTYFGPACPLGCSGAPTASPVASPRAAPLPRAAAPVVVVAPAALTPPPATPAATPSPAAPGVRGSQIVGQVRRVTGPVQVRAGVNGWKVASLGLLFVSMLPVAVGLLVVYVTVRVTATVVLGLLGFRSSPGGGGMLTWFLGMRTLGSGGGPDTIARYSYEVDCGSTIVSVRQEGELTVGAIHPGNKVRLEGTWVGGELVLSGGRNEDLGTQIAVEQNWWRYGFLAAAGLCFAVVLFSLVSVAAVVPR